MLGAAASRSFSWGLSASAVALRGAIMPAAAQQRLFVSSVSPPFAVRSKAVDRIFRPGLKYSKAEVMLLDLCSPGEYTDDLFAVSQYRSIAVSGDKKSNDGVRSNQRTLGQRDITVS